MYADYILFVLGTILLLTSAILGLLLFRSRRQSWEYRRALQEETERIDVISTLRQTVQECGEQQKRESAATELSKGSTELLINQTDIAQTQTELRQTEGQLVRHDEGTELLSESETAPLVRDWSTVAQKSKIKAIPHKVRCKKLISEIE